MYENFSFISSRYTKSNKLTSVLDIKIFPQTFSPYTHTDLKKKSVTFNFFHSRSVTDTRHLRLEIRSRKAPTPESRTRDSKKPLLCIHNREMKKKPTLQHTHRTKGYPVLQRLHSRGLGVSMDRVDNQSSCYIYTLTPTLAIPMSLIKTAAAAVAQTDVCRQRSQAALCN